MTLANPATAFPLLVVSGVLQGLTLMVVNINGVSLRQALTPDALQGRVNATGRWINWSVIPFATILGGAVATAIGLRPTIAIGAGIALLSLPWLLLSPLRSLHEMPGRAAVGANADGTLRGGRDT
jgi:MFS family permease